MADSDREILRNFYKMMSPTEGFDEAKYAYQWEYLGANGIYIHQSKVLGWQAVHGADAENPAMRDASGHAVMGDVMLMRMPRERYEQIQRARQALVREQRGEVTDEQMRAQIDERISRMVGQNISMSFKFKDRRELDTRKKGD